MKPNLAHRIALVTTLVVGMGATATLAEETQAPTHTALRTLEGTVVSVYSSPAEGNLEVVAVALNAEAVKPAHFDLLLAPQQVLDEISFDLETGDRLRVRVFVSDQGPLKVHKAMNLTRGTMVRFRSLRQVPLWGSTGGWEGGDCRKQGGHGGGHGDGQGGGHGSRGGGGGPKR
jgi:uncharacterized membrane protein YgcG